ncbi:ATP-dependent RNA helicase [Entamoeba marina]
MSSYNWDRVVTVDDSIAPLSISSPLSNILNTFGITALHPMQNTVIRHILSSTTDVAVRAPTGSGKTLCYALPLLSQLTSNAHIQAIIFVPTQPLATQVVGVLLDIFKLRNLTAAALGNSSLEVERSSLLNTQVLVGTPARFLHHFAESSYDLRWVRTVIFDETDKLLTQPALQPSLMLLRSRDDTQNGFLASSPAHAERVVFKIDSRVDIRYLLFSATLSSSPKAFRMLAMKTPLLLDFKNYNDLKKESHTLEETNTKIVMPSGIRSVASVVEIDKKEVTLVQLLKTSGHSIVFCNSNEAAYVLWQLLEAVCESFDIKKKQVVCLISSTTPTLKNKIMRKVERGEVKWLITTDVLARGIDFKNVRTVINFDCPQTTQLYVHRAGRTGRVGRSGLCHSIVTRNEYNILSKKLEKIHVELEDVFLDISNDVMFSCTDAMKNIENSLVLSLPQQHKKYF